MKPDFRFAILAMALPLALSACNGEKKQATPGTAGGEVLPGSVSDAMLPIDTVRSQPPLAPKSGGDGDERDSKPGDKKPEKRKPSSKPAEPAASQAEAPAPPKEEPKPAAE